MSRLRNAASSQNGKFEGIISEITIRLPHVNRAGACLAEVV
jgi:hypothetical protein